MTSRAGTVTISDDPPIVTAGAPGSAARPPATLAALVLALVLLGVAFRIAGLGEKLYWHDEVYTSLRLYGYPGAEVRDAFATSDVAPEVLQGFQRRSDRTSPTVTLGLLARENPLHPPLYYGLLHAWTAAFGDSIASIRSLSALISLLVLPAIVWLCRELFPGRLVGWLAVGLLAVSPAQILYAQEAREYMLWVLTIALSSAALHRAARRHNTRSWVWYAVFTTVGLYTYPLHLLVVAAHGATLGISYWRSGPTRLAAWALSAIVAILLFAPWLWVMWSARAVAEAGMSHLNQPVAASNLVRGWIAGLSVSLVALVGEEDIYAWVPRSLVYGVHLAILTCIGWSLAVVWRRADRVAALLVVTLAGGLFLFLLLLDVAIGGAHSTPIRYLAPTWVALPLAVAFALDVGIFGRDASVGMRRVWLGIAVLVIGSAIVSDVLVVSKPWGGKAFGGSRGDVAYDIAGQINAATRPLIVLESLGGENQGEAIALSYLLGDHARYRVVPDPTRPLDVVGYSEVFVFRPSLPYRQALERHASLEETARYGALFRARPR